MGVVRQEQRQRLHVELGSDALHALEGQVALAPLHTAHVGAVDIQERNTAIREMVAVSQQAVVQVRDAKTELVANLKDQQARLLRLHIEEADSISPNALRDERLRMQHEIETAEQSLAETEDRLQLDGQAGVGRGTG